MANTPLLFKTPGDPAIYFNDNGVYRHVTDMGQLNSLTGGQDFNQYLSVVPNIPGKIGQPLSNAEIQSNPGLFGSQERTQSNIAAASAAPITTQDQAGFHASAESLFAPEKAAFNTNLMTKLKQTLSSGDESLRNSLGASGQGVPGGNYGSRASIAQTLAESDAALAEAGYLSDVGTRENTYEQTLRSDEVARREQNAQTALQDQATSLGITQQEFTNMQTELTREAAVTGSQTALLTNPDFATLLTGIGSQPQYQPLLVQMLQGMGFNVTL